MDGNSTGKWRISVAGEVGEWVSYSSEDKEEVSRWQLKCGENVCMIPPDDTGSFAVYLFDKDDLQEIEIVNYSSIFEDISRFTRRLRCE